MDVGWSSRNTLEHAMLFNLFFFHIRYFFLLFLHVCICPGSYNMIYECMHTHDMNVHTRYCTCCMLCPAVAVPLGMGKSAHEPVFKHIY